MAHKKGRVIRISDKLIEILDKIREKERERGRESSSYYDSSNILSQRIINAGGLKES